MMPIARSTTIARNFLAKPLLILAVALQIAHGLLLLWWPHPVLVSNYIQLACPLLAVAACMQQCMATLHPAGRRCWLAISSAFAIWVLAQSLYILMLYVPERTMAGIRPDDALWLLFGFPILLAIHITQDGTDRVGWIDRSQAMLFFVVLYLLVFLPSTRLSLDTAFLIQDLALLLCCCMRLPACIVELERRFFVRLGLFLIVYGPSTMAGDALHRHGWVSGSLVDLVWTLPTTLFTVLVLRDALSSSQSEIQRSRLLTTVRSMQGLGAATLAFLSIGTAAFLAIHYPLLGGLFLVGAFTLFALRTNTRERAWHQAHGRLEETVLQDALTGVGNRILLRKRLADWLAHPAAHGPAVLLFADLDRFKSINDSLGHALGDRLLVEVAKRLRAASPPNAIVCRLGGDEFVVLCTAPDAERAKVDGEALLSALHTPFKLGDHILRCTASIGVVLATAGESADDLLRTADHAMYRAKQLGKDRVQLFDASLLAQLNTRWQMEADLRGCLEREGIDVAFQPIVSVKNGEISGFEALARWTHPTRGQVPPLEFIPLAEETGLILPLGAQVLEKACRQMAAWNRAWGTCLSVSVNVSPRQFADTGLLQLLLGTLERTGLDPSLLRIEITESALLVHESTVKHVLAEARAHGIRISLDDFGTGYSSLSFLLNLPVDEVKVDRSFVSDMHRDPQRRELVRTVIQLGHSLGKRVVAEGVETEQDLHELATMGCECAQGWLISRPLLADAMEADMPSITARSARSPYSSHRSPQRPALPQTQGRDEKLRAPALRDPALAMDSGLTPDFPLTLDSTPTLDSALAFEPALVLDPAR